MALSSQPELSLLLPMFTATENGTTPIFSVVEVALPSNKVSTIFLAALFMAASLPPDPIDPVVSSTRTSSMLRSFLVMVLVMPMPMVSILASFMKVVGTSPETVTLMLSPSNFTSRLPTVPIFVGGKFASKHCRP